jgi:hypothetical protein
VTDRKMLIIVPTRSRPENVAKVVDAWEETGAFDDGAHLTFAYDMDDPKFAMYTEALLNCGGPADAVGFVHMPYWKPMVHKLNTSAMLHRDCYFALGFAGDDHLPRTRGWAGRYMDALAEMGTGIVSCADGYRTDQLPTQWAMTSDIVRALGRMVPAPVEHLYCDNAIQDLGQAAGCYRYLDDVLIEHMHPLAKRGQWDEQYRNVNNEEQFERDEAAYREWKAGQAVRDITAVVTLRAAHRA